MPHVSSESEDYESSDGEPDFDSDPGSSDGHNTQPQVDYRANSFAPTADLPAKKPKVVHVTGQLINRPKRTAEDNNNETDDGHPAKSRRTRSSGQSTAAGSFVKPENEFDQELFETIYGTGEAGTEAVAQQPPSSPQLHPSFPTTASQLFRQTFPHIRPHSVRGLMYRMLADRPVVRVPVIRRLFSNVKPQNVPSYLMQATGDALPADQACERCKRGLGVYGETCVAVRDAEVVAHTLGTCANCWYNRNGCFCTLRPTWVPMNRKGAVEQAGQQQAQMKQQPEMKPEMKQQVTRRAQRNLSRYQAQRGDPFPARAAPTPAVSSPIPLPPQGSSTVTAPPTQSLDARVQGWETRYSTMSTADLLEAQKHLLERQEDVMTRMVAMNRVLSGRQGGS